MRKNFLFVILTFVRTIPYHFDISKWPNVVRADGTCGPEGIRIPDLVNANDALYQLSYRPVGMPGIEQRGLHAPGSRTLLHFVETSVGMPRIELGFRAPEARIIPLYDIPTEVSTGVRTTGILHPVYKNITIKKNGVYLLRLADRPRYRITWSRRDCVARPHWQVGRR